MDQFELTTVNDEKFMMSEKVQVHFMIDTEEWNRNN